MRRAGIVAAGRARSVALAAAAAALAAADVCRCVSSTDDERLEAENTLRSRRLFNRSVQHQIERQYGAAERCLRRALTLDATFAQAHSNLGNVLNGVRHNFADAEWHYNVAIALNRRCAFAHYNLALLLAHRRDDVAGSEERLREAVSIDPTFCNAHFNLGLAIQRTRGREREAEAHFRRALAINPHDAETHVHVGIGLYRQFENMARFRSATPAIARSKRDAALVCFGRALELERGNRSAAQWHQLLTSQRADEAMLAGDDGLPADLGGSDAGGDIDDLDDEFDKLLGGD